MLMEGTFEAEWGDDEPRHSKLVFIGRGLDPAALNRGFNGCLDTPERRQERRAALRFRVGSAYPNSICPGALAPLSMLSETISEQEEGR